MIPKRCSSINLTSKRAPASISSIRQSDIEQLFQLCRSVVWVCDGVTNRSWVSVDLVVVTTLVGLVTKEVDSRVLDSAGELRLIFQMLQTIGLVPAGRKDIE
jgi:hypothetical protein